LEILNAEALKPLGILVLPDGKCSKRFNVSSNEYWMCIVEEYTLMSFHGVGSCRMGYGVEDKESVVDSNFKYDYNDYYFKK